MRLSDLPTVDQVIEKRRQSDAAFAEEWDRSAVGRGLAILVIGYRAELGLTQEQLAAAAGVAPQVIEQIEGC